MRFKPINLVLLLPLALLLSFAATDDPPAEDPPGQEQGSSSEAEPAGDPAEETPIEDIPEDSTHDVADDAPGPRPEEIRRRRPNSDKEEREYKKTLALKDPYLHFDFLLGPTEQSGEFYNPLDWLSPDVPLGVTRYMVQDASGSVQGFMAANVELSSSPAQGDLVVLSLAYSAPQRERKLLISAQTLKPKLVLERTPPQDSSNSGELSEGVAFQRPTLRVEYIFDRVTVQKTDGPVTKGRSFRQLPYSFDIDQIPLLVRLLDFENIQWPFEAAVTDPLSARSLPLQISSASRAATLSAEPAEYQCWELPVRIGDSSTTWWVERLPPYRLIKYTLGGLTYTMMGYAEH